MTDEQRLQLITEQLIIVRDNLFRGLSKSMQKLQAQSINEVLELPIYTQTPQQRTWVELTEEDFVCVHQLCDTPIQAAEYVNHLLKEKNT
jgi:hypothetical protein